MTIDEVLREVLADVVRPIVREEVHAIQRMPTSRANTGPDYEPLWTAADVAKYLQTSRSWAYQAAEAGRLPTLRIGVLLRFEPEAIRAYARGEPPRPTPRIESEERPGPRKRRAIAKPAARASRSEPLLRESVSPGPTSSPDALAVSAADSAPARIKSAEQILEDEERVSVREAAKQLGVSTATVYKLCDNGSLPLTRSGTNAILIHPRDLAAYARSLPRSGDR